jgi:hypothetical protein
VRWRPATREERHLAWLWAVAVLSAVVLRPFWLLIAPILPACPLRTLTGVPCPTCGTTRAGLALVRGDILGALHFNPLATLAGLAFLLGGVLAPVWLALGRDVPDLPSRWPLGLRIAVLGAIVANWIWLLATGLP